MNILNKCNAKPLRRSVEESDDTQIRERGTLLASGKRVDFREETMLKLDLGPWRRLSDD